MQYLDATSKMAEWSLFVSKAPIQYQNNPSLCPNQKWWRSWGWTVLWRATRPYRNNIEADDIKQNKAHSCGPRETSQLRQVLSMMLPQGITSSNKRSLLLLQDDRHFLWRADSWCPKATIQAPSFLFHFDFRTSLERIRGCSSNKNTRTTDNQIFWNTI